MASKKKPGPMAQLLAAALEYPGAEEAHPWGDTVVKVNKKVFVFLSPDGAPEVGCSVKLPHSGDAALGLPFCKPAGYGLGKAGWVSATFTNTQKVPVSLLLEWLDESYRAIAPKKRIAELDA